MKLPPWVQAALAEFNPPATGRVTIGLEIYNGGITKMEIGGLIRVKPEMKDEGSLVKNPSSQSA